MPVPKHIHYVPPVGAAAPLVHVSSYSPFAPTTPVSYASMPGAPAILHFYAGQVAPPHGGSGGAQAPQLVVQALQAQVPRAEQQAAAAKAFQPALEGKGAPYYMHGILKYPGMSEALFEQQRIEFAGLKSPQMIQEEIIKEQRIKEASEVYAIQQAKILQEREDVARANKLHMAKEFEATRLGIVTSRLKQAEEIYAAKLEQYKNVPRNFNYEKNRAIAAQQLEIADNQVKDFQTTKYLIEQEVDQDRRQAARTEEFRIQQAKEKQDIIDAQQARINPSKKEAEKIKLTPAKHNSDEVEIHSPKIKTILKQYKSDYEGFNRKVISDAIPIQFLHTLSLKKMDSVDSRVVDLIFDLLRDNHLQSLKTLDLSDNPKSIGADQIIKLTDSFLSRNNNLETLDISCVYPAPLGRGWYPGEWRGEHLGSDAARSFGGRDTIGTAFSKLVLSVSICYQPICITIDASVHGNGNHPDVNLHTAALFLNLLYKQYDVPFKTTGSVMLEHMIRLCQNKSYKVEEDFTWGITKCLTPISSIERLSKGDIEYIKKGCLYSHKSEAVESIAKILKVFVCVTEVIENTLISHDMLEHETLFGTLFGRDNWWGITPPTSIIEKPKGKIKFSTQHFDSNCKHCDESQLKEREDSIRSDTLESEELFTALFGRDNWSGMKVRGREPAERKEEAKQEKREERLEEFTPKPFVAGKRYDAGSIKMNPYLLKIDVTTIINLNLSHSNMDDVGANIVANLLKRGSLPNLKSLNVSGNYISFKGEEYFVKALQNLK